MNLSNVTIGAVDLRQNASYTISTTVVIRSIGSVAFVLNIFALVYILRLWKSQKRENSFYIQLAFVCANDVGCGLMIILMSIPVSSVTTVYICGFSYIILNTLTCMSQGNIFFICLQRYMFARNIRATALKWKARLSKTLLSVNGIIGAIVFTINITMSGFFTAYRAKECTLAVFDNFGSQSLLLLFAIGVPTVLTSDVLCCLAIVKLSRSGLVAPSDRSTSRTSDQDELPGSSGFKKCQKRAIITVILILLAFNLSTLPNVTSVFLGFVGVELSLTVSRLLLFCIFGNSLANPIIYITRMQSLRQMIIDDILKFKQLRFQLR